MSRIETIKAAIRPMLSVANYNVEDCVAAVRRSIPDVEPLEIADAFMAMADDAEAEAALIRQELLRRKGGPVEPGVLSRVPQDE